MTVLPKVNYLSSMLPVAPPTNWFKSLGTAVSKFNWKNKPPRIKLTTLQNPNTHGGLEAPNSDSYVLTTPLQYILKWINPDQTDSTWTDTEQTQCKDIRIYHTYHLSATHSKTDLLQKPNNRTTLTAWWKFH